MRTVPSVLEIRISSAWFSTAISPGVAGREEYGDHCPLLRRNLGRTMGIRESSIREMRGGAPSNY